MVDFPVQPTAQDVVKFRSGDTVRVVNCWKANEVGEVVAAAWTRVTAQLITEPWQTMFFIPASAALPFKHRK